MFFFLAVAGNMSCGRRCSEAILKCEGHSGAGAHHNHTWAATKSVRNTNTQKETNITEDKTQIQTQTNALLMFLRTQTKQF